MIISNFHPQTSNFSGSVTIIGGGPAGAVAGLLLARAGWDVAIIEQHRYPRDKVCGECLSSLGVEVLARLGLHERIKSLGAMILRRAALVDQRGRQATFSLPKPMWGISRCALDSALLDSARQAGAQIVQPARCEGVFHVPLTVIYRDLERNVIKQRSSDYILLADGRAALIPPRPRPTADLGVKAHFTGIDDELDRISLFGLQGHYVGLAPIENGRWNLAMSVPASKVKRCGGDLNALFESILDENTRLRHRLHGATRVGDWLASPLPRFPVRKNWPNRIIPIGNSAAALEPIGGEGMGLAMRSAELAAGHLIGQNSPWRHPDLTTLSSQMHSLWRRKRLVCRAGAMLLSNRRTAGLVTPLAPPLAPLALRLIGK